MTCGKLCVERERKKRNPIRHDIGRRWHRRTQVDFVKDREVVAVLLILCHHLAKANAIVVDRDLEHVTDYTSGHVTSRQHRNTWHPHLVLTGRSLPTRTR